MLNIKGEEMRDKLRNKEYFESDLNEQNKRIEKYKKLIKSLN